MWHKYVMEIKKDGYMKYISHLDMVKLFKNAFKKTEIKLAFSQGFNPHPKMGFAQPLSLGFSSSCELLEFETQEHIDPNTIASRLKPILPKGIEILDCKTFTHNKSFAARTFAATYEISIPVNPEIILNSLVSSQNADELCDAFLKQEQITTLKKQKKTGNKIEIDIKHMIRKLNVDYVDFQFLIPKVVLTATLDSGSNSNLSPELVYTTFASFAGIKTAREDVEIKRTALFFEK